MSGGDDLTPVMLKILSHPANLALAMERPQFWRNPQWMPAGYDTNCHTCVWTSLHHEPITDHIQKAHTGESA